VHLIPKIELTSTFPLARPDPHCSRCVVVHLASADYADYVADSVAAAVGRPTKNGQRPQTKRQQQQQQMINAQQQVLIEEANANANVHGKVASGSALASGSGSSSRTSNLRGGKGKEREWGDSVHDASGGGGAVGRREDHDGW
jgi:hypothetical protein